MREGSAHAGAIWWFVLANVALAAALAHGYLAAGGLDPGTIGWSFAAGALLGQIAAAELAIGLVLLLLAATARGRRLVAVVGAFLVTVVALFLYVDRKIFALFRFHTNGLVLGVVSSADGWEAIHMRAAEVLLACGAIALCFVMEVALYGWLLARVRRAPAPRLWRRWAALGGTVVAVVLVERLTWGACDLADVREVTSSTRVVPLYRPVTLHGFGRRYLGITVAARPKVVDATGAPGALRYPAAPLRFREPPVRPNIVWIVADSLRADMLAPETMPHTWAFGTRSQVFGHHVSGGNGTQYGIFSLFYGLYGSYWPQVTTERVGPVLFERLRDLGYTVYVGSSTSLEYGGFRRSAFATVLDQVEDALPPASIAEKDAYLIDRLDAVVAGTPPGRPFFAFLFLDSPHTPYDFARGFGRYRPFQGYFFLKDVRPDWREALFNRYRNAVVYTDHLIGEALRRLEARGVLQHTVVLITGDHGEEFWEHGHWSHTSAFTPEQTRVPLVLHVPGMAPARHGHLTAHQDVVPTFLAMLGVENPPSDYSQGHSLFDPVENRLAVICGFGRCALHDGEGSLVFGVEPYNAHEVDVFDADYHEVPNPLAVLGRRSRQLLTLAGQMGRFYAK